MALSATTLLLCDLVWEDPVSRNITLLGVFTALRATRFPSPQRSLSLYTLLLGRPDETGRLLLECVDVASGTTDRLAHGSVTIGQEGHRHANFRLDRFRFPRPGRFMFRLTCDGHLIAQHTVTLKEAGS